MVSKTVICVFLLALVAVSYAKPHHDQSSEHRNQRQRNGQNERECENVSRQQDNDSNSNESERVPCRLITEDGQTQRQGRKQPLHIQDTSNEYESQVRKIQIVTSQEQSDAEKVIKQGPQHKVMTYGTQKISELMHGVKSIVNHQKPRGQNADNESSEQDNSGAGRNQIYRQ